LTSPGSTLLDRLVPVIREHLPAGVTPAYLEAFVLRNRPALVSALDQALAARAARVSKPPVNEDALPPEEWTAARRTKANLAAMRIAASTPPESMTAEDRRVLSGYSGWGGLSIDAVSEQFPAGFPVPEERGLIHEYYTPTKVCAEVARVVEPLLPELSIEGQVLALEPSAGIGRFVRAFTGHGFEDLRWLTVEWSELSSRMLQAIRPDLALYTGPFERWVREHGDEYRGRIGLVVANPPYGQRGASVADDPDRSFREKQAYAYFMRRALDLLAPNGLGVFLVPYGFLTGQAARNLALREKVLKEHHLACAYRLPSRIFPGAELVTDLLFFRARGGSLLEVDETDRFILEGRYFEQFPANVLGREVGTEGGEDDQTAKPRWGYQVLGEFSKLPDLVERPTCGACQLNEREIPEIRDTSSRSGRVGVARQVESPVMGLPEDLSDAVSLGLRVDAFLAATAAGDSELPSLLWRELHDALVAWADANGNPWASVHLHDLAKRAVTGAERFLAAFEKSGKLIESLQKKPAYRPTYEGRPDDVLAQAEMLFRTHRDLPVSRLMAFHQKIGGTLGQDAALVQLFESGWFLDGEAWDRLVPSDHYLTGHLWPRYDRASEKARQGDAQAQVQSKKLLDTIRPAVFDDIDGVSARQGWVPLDLVEGWMSETLNFRYGDVKLSRRDGLVVPEGVSYDDIDETRALAPEARWCVGWMNHDKTVFKPKKKQDDDLDKVRVEKAKEWDASFRAYVGSDEARRTRVEDAYNRSFRGFVAPTWSAEPLPIARWAKDGPRLHPHQVAGARRVLANRGGLIAFDVGVGKTYAGIALLAQARQDGWVRRPVILVPNSIVWKWEADILRVLPDYRVVVIGSKKKVVLRGERKGLVTSDTDTPEERARKWTRFQGGEYDVALLTYTALGRTRMNEGAIRDYANQTEAIQREVKLRQRNAASMKKLTERQEAILKEGVSAWVAEQMEIPEGWDYDPGIAWDDIGIDLLIVDEAQNYKNLYLPEPREGGVPRFMGNAGEGSKRAWQLDFRCAAVRRKTGGSGIVLLSATPAKNSPLEFYNLVQYIDHEAWSRMGIRDPEQFIDRYLRIELKPVVDSKMDVVERAAVVGFQNLHELRETIFRYGEFKTAEQVGLKLPEPRSQVVEVDMDPLQNQKYDRYIAAIEEALESDNASDKAKILGLLARMALVAIHGRMDEGFDWKTGNAAVAASGESRVDPHSPKFDAVSKRILANRTCGHIVFVDNVAAHAWVRAVLVEAGIPIDRIAILNAEMAPAAADRARIAKEFNGVADEGLAPKFDVVIANAIAYEGIDLQARTCAIHHLDLPWEPATLQQRNGRGVRQGNTLSTIEINYYFARRSQDGLRFNLIQGKRGWMIELLESQRRDTNNPGAQMEMGPEEILLLISRDPAKTAQRLAAVKQRREEEARQRVAQDAARLLKGANARFRKAEATGDPTEAARFRLEAEERLKDLANVDPGAWPWVEQAYTVRSSEMIVPDNGACPVYEGFKVGLPNPWNPERIDFAEFGRVREGTIGVREAGSAVWSPKKADEVPALGIKPEHLALPWPSEDDPRTEAALGPRIDQTLRYSGSWPALGWAWASDAWIERHWPRAVDRVVQRMGEVSSWYAERQKVPAVVDGKLEIASGPALRGGALLPPTRAGWREFLALALASGLKFTELEDCGLYWWERRIPRDLLSAARKEAEGAGQVTLDVANDASRKEAA
jgi:hypothetical protein